MGTFALVILKLMYCYNRLIDENLMRLVLHVFALLMFISLLVRLAANIALMFHEAFLTF